MSLLMAIACYGSLITFSLQVLCAQMPREKVQPTQPLSVCAVLERITQHNGRMVTVRGVLRQTPRHGTSLGDESGETVCSGQTGKQKDWTAALYLLWPSNPSVSVSFDRDRASEQEMDKVLKAADITSKDRIVVTLEGQLEAKPNFEVFRQPNGEVYSTGYGSGGEYPAQLVIRRVVETRISRPGQ
jgi:hypothetical protein